MNKEEFDAISEELNNLAENIAKNKRKCYTGGSGDQLANFKRIAERTGQTPLQVWSVYLNKQVDSINSYVKDGSESEPIETRFADTLNYLYLGMALIKEAKGIDIPYVISNSPNDEIP